MSYEDLSKDELLVELQKRDAAMAPSSVSLNSALFDLLPYGGELISPQGKILNCSPSTARMLGYEISELIGTQITRLLDPASCKTFQQKFPELLNGEPQTAEICMICKNGARKDILRSATPVYNEEGTVESILAINVDITNLKQSEKSLRIERDNSQAILGAMADGVYIVNNDYDIQYINPALVAEFGDVNGRKCYEYFHGEGAPCSWCKSDEVFEGKTVRWECTISKNQKTYDLISTPLINHDGSISKLEIFRDITEHKQAEKILQESEDRYRALFNNDHSIMLLIDPVTAEIVDANPAAANFYGWSQEDLKKKKISEINTLSERSVLQKLDFAKKKKREHYFFSHRIANGDIRDVEVYSNSVVVSKRDLLFSVIHDVTERKKAQERLAESEGRLRSTLQSMNDLVFIIDLDSRILSCNAPSKDLYVQPHEFLGKKHGQFMPENIDRLFRQAMSQIKEGKSAEYEYDLTMHGGRKWYASKLSPLTLGDEITGAVAVIRDITERKQSEKILLKSSRMEATATLAAGIAHDFNNLMVVVLGYSDLLKLQFKTEPDAMDMLNAIGLNAQKAGELAQQLLAFARGGNYQPKLMNLNDSIEEALRLNERSFPPRVRIERDIEPDLLNLQADPTQMSQVIINLCINSVEAIEGNGRVILTTRNIDVDEKFAAAHVGLKVGRHIYLAVEDTGCGMTKEVLARTFEPFYSTKFQGRGLGLAAVYGIVKNHEGHISAYSEVGKGTTFKVYLPAVEEDIPVVKWQPSEALHGEETILIIDDEQMVLDVTQRILEKYGYRVLLACDGLQAVKIVEEFDGDIDLALLDMGMPSMGGAEAYPLIKKNRPDLKVIICSGYEKDMPARELLDAGANSFLQKPFQAGTLVEQIRKVLDSDDSPDPAE